MTRRKPHHTARLKFDWELVLRQMDDAYRREPNIGQRQALHNTMLDQLDWERGAYTEEFIDTARVAYDEMEVIWDDDPEKDLIFAKHWASWRAAIRKKMRLLGDVEERLDAALVRAIEQTTGGG